MSKVLVHHDPPPEVSPEPELGSRYRYPAETSSFSIAFRLGRLRVPKSSTEGCLIAPVTGYRRPIPAMESEAISSMIRGGRVLRASTTPNSCRWISTGCSQAVQ